MKDSPPRLGFLGAGQMATALARGWLAARLIDSRTARAGDPVPQAREAFQRETGISCIADNRAVVEASDVLVLAVKPQSLPELVRELGGAVQPRHLLISIVTGTTLRQLGEAFGAGCRAVRVMPNTPCLVGASASAFAGNDRATEADLQLVERLMGAVGVALRLDEKMLDAVTGLSGSGPAFVYVMIEALSDGGVRMGLTRPVATLLAAQTVLGAAQMVLQSGQHPGALKDQVASAGGTTIAGLHALERGGVRAALMNAVEAAALRAAELGRALESPPKKT
jgi:pyrroline-5-carboxylate reductase